MLAFAADNVVWGVRDALRHLIAEGYAVEQAQADGGASGDDANAAAGAGAGASADAGAGAGAGGALTVTAPARPGVLFSSATPTALSAAPPVPHHAADGSDTQHAFQLRVLRQIRAAERAASEGSDAPFADACDSAASDFLPWMMDNVPAVSADVQATVASLMAPPALPEPPVQAPLPVEQSPSSIGLCAGGSVVRFRTRTLSSLSDDGARDASTAVSAAVTSDVQAGGVRGWVFSKHVLQASHTVGSSPSDGQSMFSDGADSSVFDDHDGGDDDRHHGRCADDDDSADEFGSDTDSWFTTPTTLSDSLTPGVWQPTTGAAAGPPPPPTDSQLSIPQLAMQLHAGHGFATAVSRGVLAPPPAAPPTAAVAVLPQLAAAGAAAYALPPATAPPAASDAGDARDPHSQRPHTVLADMKRKHVVGQEMGRQGRASEQSAVMAALSLQGPGGHKSAHRGASLAERSRLAVFDAQRSHPLLVLACARHAVLRPPLPVPRDAVLPKYVVALAKLALPVFLPGVRKLCYFEFRFAPATSAAVLPPRAGPLAVCVGLAPHHVQLTGMLGTQPHTLGLAASGHVVCGCQWRSTTHGYGVGDTVGVLVRWLTAGPWTDAGAPGSTAVQVTFSVNKVVTAVTAPMVLTPGSQLLPAVSVGSPNVRVHAHFSAADVSCRRRQSFVVGVGHGGLLDNVTGTSGVHIVALDGTTVLSPSQ